MKWKHAFVIGVLSGAVMSLVLALFRLFGLNALIGTLLGTMFGLPISANTWLLGFLIHLVISGSIAILYALGFEYFTHRANGYIGALFSLFHILVAGIMIGFMPVNYQQISQEIAEPGFFMMRWGSIAIIAFLSSHLIYGTLLGLMYGPVKHVSGRYRSGEPSMSRG